MTFGYFILKYIITEEIFTNINFTCVITIGTTII